MKTLKFKSNINCGSCIAKVASVLDQEKKIESWNIDTSDPGKILTISTSELSTKEIVALINKTGYKILPLE